MTLYIILTVVKSGRNNQFALQVSKEYLNYFKKCKTLKLDNENQLIVIEDGLIAYKKNGRITHPIINQWIIENNLNNFPPRYPVKLIFKFSYSNNNHRYVLYLSQENRLQL